MTNGGSGDDGIGHWYLFDIGTYSLALSQLFLKFVKFVEGLQGR